MIAQSNIALATYSKRGDINGIKLAIADGADINGFSEKSKATPLMQAASNGHMEAIKYLCSIGADPIIKDAFGALAVEYAGMCGYPDIVIYFITIYPEVANCIKYRKEFIRAYFENEEQALSNINGYI